VKKNEMKKVMSCEHKTDITGYEIDETKKNLCIGERQRRKDRERKQNEREKERFCVFVRKYKFCRACYGVMFFYEIK
jgi:hypothetical protein